MMTDAEVADQIYRADYFIEQLRDAITATAVRIDRRLSELFFISGVSTGGADGSRIVSSSMSPLSLSPLRARSLAAVQHLSPGG